MNFISIVYDALTSHGTWAAVLLVVLFAILQKNITFIIKIKNK